MRILVPFVLLISVLVAAPPIGCALPKADPGQDQLVVTAEAQLKNSIDVFQAITEFDHQNLAYVRQTLPEFHNFVQDLRRNFWVQYYDPAHSAVRLYKQSRLPEDGQLQEDRLQALANVVRQARLALLNAQAKRVSP